MEIAGADFASYKANALHKVRILFLQVLSGTSCAIQVEIQHPHHVFVARLAIFNWDLYVHRPNGLGIEVCSLYV